MSQHRVQRTFFFNFFVSHLCQIRLCILSLCTIYGDYFLTLILYFIETPLKAFANRADPDQAALGRAASNQGLLYLLLKYDISDPTQLDLTNTFFVLSYRHERVFILLFIVGGA